MVFEDKTLEHGMAFPSKDPFKKQETKFCKGMKAVFGGELKSCEVDFIHADIDSSVDLHGRLHFYKNKLETAADEEDAIPEFIQERLTSVCYTQFICNSITGNVFHTQEGYTLTSNFSKATPKIEGQNDTNYYKAQESVCDEVSDIKKNIVLHCLKQSNHII
ncbi:hypothetical protein NP493_1653g00015 [Ridgeia piscesae]|uniref:Uncharacterized protein n=1 Tax=Ridgeia piscesae TaxID=27915 RepID=A0AAD9JXN1_RIDPI|nr:hypothetical protein NP493_1653g00015 [Ridgeia piscesae]